MAGNLPLAGAFPKADDADWRTLVNKALKGADFDKTLLSHTYDGLTLKPLYTRESEPVRDPGGMPGAAPFIRGFRASEGDRPWEIRQLYAETDPADANTAILGDLEGGASAVSLQVAAPGQSGVVVGSVDDLDRALEQVALDLAGVWLEAGHATATSAGFLTELWARRNIKDADAIGGFGADPLGTLARTGVSPIAIDQAMQEIVDLARQTHERLAQVTAVSVDARPYHGGGASEAEELACLCATMVAYLRALKAGGLSPADGLAQMEFALACDADMFLNVAKLRAARALIARIAEVSDASGALPGLRLHAMTSFRMFSRLDPQVNILRTTIAAAAAALGGANSITVLPYTYANGAPDAFARRIARNIQIILEEESSLGAVIDPAGGSWYVEEFTRELAGKAWGLFQEIEKQGGMANALSKGFVQKMIAKTATERARDVAHGEFELTGVSSFPNLGEELPQASPHAVPDDVDDPAITVEPIPLRRPAEPFERLRQASDDYLDEH
ncbi:MAG: methylmalonyl-CoA mutase subunit beta, partial [Pseudomonadota bacterium]